MTPEMQVELISAIEDAGSSDCRVVVLRGAGDAFCSGLDLTALQQIEEKTAAAHQEDAQRIALLFRSLYECSKPTIAAVHGAAIAGGTGLATICDFTLATPAARFGYTEVRIGFVPALVSAFLALQIGDKRCRDLLLTGRIFDAAEGYRLGLVTEVVDAEVLTARVESLAKSIIVNSPRSLRATKQLMASQNKIWLDAAIAEAMHCNAEARVTKDFVEGISAFLQKRKPYWAS